LKDKAYLSPAKLKYKVFIIDEVHMLTKDAFNALLKLIEEPPKHTIFILCTTDADKIPETVLSRLIRVDFRKGGKEELRRSLNKIIKGEKIEIEEEAIDFILGKSDGSFRNLQKNFNELFLAAGNKLSLKVVEGFFISKNGSYSPVDFEKDLAKGDVTQILKRLEKMSDEGVNLVGFREDLLMYSQQKLLVNFKAIAGDPSLLNLKKLEAWINLLIRASKQEKETEIDQLPLELAVVDFLNEFGDTNANIKKEEKVLVVESNSEIKEVETKVVKIKEEKLEEPKKTEVVTVDVSGLTLDKVEESWGNVLIAVKPFNHSVEAFLRAARPIKLEGRNLILEVFYPFHKDRLEEPRNRKIVEDGLLKVLGVELVFECVLGKSKREPLVIQNDTPIESVSEHLVEEKKDDKKDLYDVAKDIFG
jgi:DNA polymerase-3 subunit gamma/tau